MNFYQQAIFKTNQETFADGHVINKVIAARHFILRNYDSPISVDQMAMTVCISKFHFIRLFKRYYGRTPNRFLAEVRIAGAKEMLKQGMPVSDVCVAVGFSSVSSFTTLYKQATGTTPANYKRLLAGKSLPSS